MLESGEVMVIRGNARRGFEYPMQKFVLVTETDIFGKEARKRKKRSSTAASRFRILPSFLSGTLSFMRIMVLESTAESKKWKLTMW